MEQTKKAFGWRVVYLSVLGAIVLFTIIGFITVKIEKEYMSSYDRYESVAANTDELTGESYTIEGDLYVYQLGQAGELFGGDLMFYTNHQEITVYADGEEVYYVRARDTIWGHSTGSIWNIIDLPDDACEIRVEVNRVYSDMDNLELTFYKGNAIVMQNEMILNGFPGVVICMTIVIVGICMIMFWVVGREKRGELIDIFYLGIASILLGIWAMGETQTIILLIPNRVMASYVAFSCLNLLCVPFVMFTRIFTHLKDRYAYKAIIAYNVIEWLVCQILQITGVKDVRQNAIFVHIALGLAMIYMLYGIIFCLIHRKHKKRAYVQIVGLAVIAVSYMADMKAYYTDSIHTNQVSKLGFLFYILLLSFVTAKASHAEIQEMRLLALYKEMATKDMLTRCFNRNAYSEDTKALEEGPEANRDKLQLFTFDLNHLKACNDTLGHAAGDQYLLDASKLLQKLLGKYGKLYRIGGDEFLAMTHGVSETRVTAISKWLEEQEFLYGPLPEGVHLKIAMGYAIYDPYVDQTIEATRERADAKLYENKKELKERK